jgi:hypothetical protein
MKIIGYSGCNYEEISATAIGCTLVVIVVANMAGTKF